MIKITKTDTQKEVGGVWTEYHGVRVQIARMHNAKFLKTIRTKARNTPEGSLAALNEKDAERITVETLAETILVNWEPFVNVENGETVEYSKENAIKLLEHDFDFRDFVSDFSNNIDNFLLENDVSGK